MKRLLPIVLTLISLTVFAQQEYSNHWIDFNQEYLKISFRETGVYRLEYKDIQRLSGAVNRPGDIRVIQRGREVLKTGTGLADGRFDEGDYYEFFLKANQGEQDSLAYIPHSNRPPVIGNLFSDDSYIFVTVGPAAGRNYTPGLFQTASVTEDFHIAREVTSFNSTWSFNNLIGLVPFVQQSYYERGESWSGPLVYSNGGTSERVSVQNYTPQPEYPATFNALIYTRSHVYHEVTAHLNEKPMGTVRHVGFDHFRLGITFTDQDLDAGGSFTFSTQSNTVDVAAAYSVTNYTLTYPQSIDLAGKDTLTLNLPTSTASSSLLQVKNAGAGLIAYDITDAHSGRRIPFSGNTVYVENRAAVKRVFLASQTQRFGEGQMIRFTRPSLTANYILITHPTLLEAAEEYRAYRASETGGSYQTDLLEIQDIYNQFNYGERSPVAIREYLRYQMQGDTTKERFLLLVGKPVSFPNSLKTDAHLDLVPSFGYPGSDALFSTGLGGLHPDIAAYHTGRIAARQSLEVRNDLQKVKEFESQPSAEWKKQVLHLNGGIGAAEINSFKTFMEGMTTRANQSAINAVVTHRFKQSTENTEQVNISRETNQGLGFISYFGHGSSSTLDFNIGYASNAQLGFNNKGKYPFMYFNGCGVSNIFYQYNPLSTDWLFTPDKGAIAVLANSYWAYTSSSMSFLETFYSKLFNTPELLGQPVGKIIREAIARETRKPNYNPFDQSNSHQLILQGDPALIVNPFDKPDYAFKEESLGISSLNATTSLQNSDQVTVTAEITNLGRIAANEVVDVKTYLDYADGSTESSGGRRITRSFGSVYSDTLPLRPGLRKVRLVIDEGKKLAELSTENNTLHLDVDWDDARNNAIYPYAQSKDETPPVLLAYINDALPAAATRIYPSAPLIRFILKDENRLTASAVNLRAFLKAPGDAAFVALPDVELRAIDNNTLEGQYQSPTLPGTYEFLLNGTDAAGNITGQDLRLNWTITEENVQNVAVSPNPTSGFIKFMIRNSGNSTAAITLNDLSGKTLHSEEYSLKSGPNEVFLRIQPPAGTYIYSVRLGDQHFSGRLLLIR